MSPTSCDQQSVTVLNDVEIFFLLFFVLCIGQQFRETDDSIQRRAYLMAHIGKERAFKRVAALGLFFGYAQGFLHLFLGGYDPG